MPISDERRAYNRAWLESNREHVRDYREATKERRNARRRELYAADPARRAAAVEAERRRRKTNPLQRRCRQHGITPHAYELMENEGCAVCGAHPEFDATVRLHIDHNHTTGKVRGLLCQPCNLALGHLRDDPIRIIALYHYIMEADA